MGIQLATEVIGSADVSGSYKAVLIVLAFRSDDRTGHVTVSQQDLADDSGLSIATVNRALRYFEVSHIIGRSRQQDGEGYRAADEMVMASERLRSRRKPTFEMSEV